MPYDSVLLFGAPGSGKGTQGKVVGAIPGFYHLACGDVFRRLDPQSELGKLAAAYSSRGELVPNELTVRLWRKYIEDRKGDGLFHPESQILVLDGIPRNPEQARLLAPEINVLKIIHLVCPDKAKIVDRLRKRALRENRQDDADEKVICHRMEVYEQETRPVLEAYPGEKIVEVDATLSPIGVLAEVVNALVPVKDAHDRAAR